MPPLVAYGAVAIALLLATPLIQPALDARLESGFDRGAWYALVGSLALLCAAIDLGWRLPRRALCLPLCLAAAWLGIETLAAPLLVRPLRLWQYAILSDVDHRPPPFAPECNADGLRGTDDPAAFLAEEENLLFLGDSFTWGELVQPHEAFPFVAGELVARRFPERGFRVANLGWSSSSPLLSWRRLSDLGERYQPDLVVLCLDMSDFHDDLRSERMLERRGLYAFYDRLPIMLRLFEALAPELYRRSVAWSAGGGPTDRYFPVQAPLERTRRWIEPLERYVARIAAWCRERRADFVLVFLPRGFQYDERESPENWERDRYQALGPWVLEPFRYLDELRLRVDHPVVSLLDDFRSREHFPTCFEDDPHWNASGHQVAARAIARALQPVLEARLAAGR